MYAIVNADGWYVIHKDGEPLLTPLGLPVRTVFGSLAKRLLRDLRQYGEDPSDPISLVAFHYAMIDFFSREPHSALEANIALGLELGNDWTFSCPTANPEPMMKWMSLFGTHSTNSEKAKVWLSSLTLMQLCAVCVIGRGLESVNIPYIVASILDPKKLQAYAKEVDSYYPYVGVGGLTKFFKNFLFYFNVESKASGEAKGAVSVRGEKRGAMRVK